MDEATRRRICRLIAGLVVVDDDLDDAEDRFVDNMLHRFGFRKEERQWLFPIVDQAEAARELKALPSELQHQVFQLLVEAAASDKKFVKEEQEYLMSVAKVLGISESEVHQRVKTAMGA